MYSDPNSYSNQLLTKEYAMEDLSIPARLNEAIFSEPLRLQVWVMLLVIANIAAIPFVLAKEKGAWKVRSECVAIIVSFVVDWMHNTFGYGRLLEMVHLVAWTRAFVCALKCREEPGFSYSW